MWPGDSSVVVDDWFSYCYGMMAAYIHVARAAIAIAWDRVSAEILERGLLASNISEVKHYGGIEVNCRWSSFDPKFFQHSACSQL